MPTDDEFEALLPGLVEQAMERFRDQQVENEEERLEIIFDIIAEGLGMTLQKTRDGEAEEES